MNDDPIIRIRNIAQALSDKAIETRAFMYAAPDIIRTYQAYGDYISYLSDELERSPSCKINLSVINPSLDILESSLKWKLPEMLTLVDSSSAASIVTRTITEVLIDNDEALDSKFLVSAPESYRFYTATDKTIFLLNKIKPNLGDTWRTAWNQLAIGNSTSIKNAATNARTTIDEISWKSDYELLKKFPWCKYDDKKQPTRATRFAWILYGKDLPNSLNNDPTNDITWKSFGAAYADLGKYVHIVHFEASDIILLDTIFKSLQTGLETYLNYGRERLMGNLES